MSEDAFVEILKKRLEKELEGYSITCKESLIYKVIVDANGAFLPNDPSKVKRGNYAFQTDLLIKRGNIPLVVVEAKIKGFTTHDVITYSSKAVKHKGIYPHLMYGLVVGDSEVITNKFFTHNQGFDFALTIKNKNKLNPFVNIIKDQVKNSEILLQILKDKNQTRSFSTKIEVEYV